MKKLNSKRVLTLASTLLALGSAPSFAAIFPVTVGPNNTNTFSPNNFTGVAVGDTVRFTWATGTHNVVNIGTPPPAPSPSFNGPLQSSGTYDYKPLAAGTYNYQCTPHPGMTGTFTVSAASTPPPTPTIAGPAQVSGCAGQVTLTASSVGATSYQWRLNGNNLPGVTTGSFTPLMSGTYSVTATNAAGTSSPSSNVTVTLFPAPNSNFTIAGGPTTFNFSIPTVAGMLYSWNFGNSMTSTQQNPSVTYTTSGVYMVTLMATQSGTTCSTSTTKTITVTTAISDVPGLAGFRFGPNPAKNELLLHTGALKADVRLMDLTGKKVAILRTRDESSAEKVISLATFPTGLYFLEVATTEARGVEKIVIQ